MKGFEEKTLLAAIYSQIHELDRLTGVDDYRLSIYRQTTDALVSNASLLMCLEDIENCLKMIKGRLSK